MRIKINNDEEELNGLFNYTFYGYHSKHIYENIVTASASSIYDDRGDPKITIDPTYIKSTSNDEWISKSEVNSNITVSFIKHLFSIDSYTLKSRKGIEVNCPLEWVLEATNDMKNWKRIHYKLNGSELVGNNVTYHTKCPHEEFFQYYRFTMIGENYHKLEEEKYMFALGQIEFFGSLFEIKCTLPHYEFIHLFRFIYLPIFLFTST